MKFEVPSIARSVAMYFIIAGIITLSTLAVGVRFFSSQFNELAVAGNLAGAAEDIEDALILSGDSIDLDLSEIERWGYDALFGNIGYRVIDGRTSELLLSNAQGNSRSLIDSIPMDVPKGSSDLTQEDASVYRMRTSIEGKDIIIDLARSDRLGELAGEAVVPAVIESAIATILVAAVLFLASLLFASRRISAYVKDMANSLVAAAGKPGSDLVVDETRIPSELKPLALAFRSAVNEVIASHEAEKRFTENAAHELKTPLTIARLSIEKAPGLDKGVKSELLQQIDATAIMVERLLEVSRAQQNASSRHQSVDLVEVAHTVRTLMQPLASRERVRIEICTQGGGLEIESDHTAWVIAIKNLVENALLHAVGVSLIRILVLPDQVVIENDGSSIRPEDRLHIFERFFRGKEVTGKGGGGLGLSIVKQVVESVGASIEHSDRHPTGSVFRIRFRET